MIIEICVTRESNCNVHNKKIFILKHFYTLLQLNVVIVEVKPSKKN